MSVIGVAVKHLVALGMAGDELAAAIAEMQQAEDTRSTGAKRQARYRERLEERNKASQSVTCDATVTPPPSLDKEIPPRPPKEINPIPRVNPALARKAAGFGPPQGVDLLVWNTFCQQRKKGLTQIAFDRITKTLAEGADAGWPPGELVGRAIESGHETIWMPKEARNGTPRQPNFSPGQSLRGSRPDPSLDLLRAAQLAQQADCGRPASDWGDHRETGASLPAIWTG